ncbi:hypothetical protein Tco_0087736 [Tanacetum coccineum]
MVNNDENSNFPIAPYNPSSESCKSLGGFASPGVQRCSRNRMLKLVIDVKSKFSYHLSSCPVSDQETRIKSTKRELVKIVKGLTVDRNHSPWVVWGLRD